MCFLVFCLCLKWRRSFYSNIQVILAIHPHSFACLQHANMEGEGLVYIYHMNGVNVYHGRQREGGVPDQRTLFAQTFFVLNNEWQVFCLPTFRTSGLAQTLQEASSSFFPFGNPALFSVYLHCKKLEVNLTQKRSSQLQSGFIIQFKMGYLSCRIYTTSHFYHSVGLQCLCTQSSNMA